MGQFKLVLGGSLPKWAHNKLKFWFLDHRPGVFEGEVKSQIEIASPVQPLLVVHVVVAEDISGMEYLLSNIFLMNEEETMLLMETRDQVERVNLSRSKRSIIVTAKSLTSRHLSEYKRSFGLDGSETTSEKEEYV